MKDRASSLSTMKGVASSLLSSGSFPPPTAFPTLPLLLQMPGEQLAFAIEEICTYMAQR